MKDRKKRTLVIGILCCLLVFMGVGFAVMNATLNIDGTATAINTWDVRMTSITVIDNSDGASNNAELTKINEDGISANFRSDFTKPGDYITYEIKVENNGSIDAILNDISITLNVAEQDKNLFNITDNRPEDMLLPAGEFITFTIKVEYRLDADRMPSSDIEYTVKVDYSQQTEIPSEGETEEDWTFKVNSDGLITAYNYEKGTDVVVPAEVDGIAVTKIDSLSFVPEYDALYYVTESGTYVVIKDESNFDAVKNAFESSSFAVGENNYYTQSQFDALGYVVYGVYAGKVDFGTNQVSQVSSSITSLDFSKAFNLEEIGMGAFMNVVSLSSVNFGNINSLKSIGIQAFNGSSITGELVLPEGLTDLNLNAFQGNKITTLTIPSTITFIDEGVFENNPIEKIIFRMTAEDFEANVRYAKPLCDSYDTVEKVYEPIA